MKTIKIRRAAAPVLLTILLLSAAGCAGARRPREPEAVPAPQRRQEAQRPALPQPIRTEANQEPRLKVYIVEEQRVEEMAFEDYVAGVVGGEIKNDWPEETLKAQAIIARSFVLHFIETKGRSKYENAHVSTDIEEAQAWNQEAVNERIKQAIRNTRGQVIVHGGRFARTWFHSNAAGKTATAAEGLAYPGDPPYIQVVESPDDPELIPENEFNWSASFPKAAVIQALEQIGSPVRDFSRVEIGERGPSGRALQVLFDGTPASAPPLRLALGSQKMRSTLLTDVALEGGQVVFQGRGYGHGVGMSQWGAYKMAQEGRSAEEIISHYFPGAAIVDLWE